MSLDVQIYTKEIKLQQALKRLEQNEDFKLVILDSYLKSYCADAIKSSTYPTQDREYHIARAQAAGYLQQYFESIKAQGDQAENDLYFTNNHLNTTNSIGEN